MNSFVSIVQREVYQYPKPETLFRPSEHYPEYPFSSNIYSATESAIENDVFCVSNTPSAFSNEPNYVYDMVRESFHLLGYDSENYEKPTWNPLKQEIKPGQTVLIKPNMVMEVNHIKENGTDCLYTNPSVVAAVIDYVWIALQQKGKIVIGDAPMQECKFDVLLEQSGYKDLIHWYQSQGVNIEIVDFRGLKSEVHNGFRVQHISKDALGKIIDLGQESEFCNVPNPQDFRITNYDPNLLNQHHNGIKNEYFISDYVLQADVIINMPKPKSHRKAGATIALKNFIGINVRKEFLPHHTLGAKECAKQDERKEQEVKQVAGDEYQKKDIIHSLESYFLDKKNIAQFNGRPNLAKIYRILKGIFSRLPHKDRYKEGSWYGNETISKTICDLNKIVMYADTDGKMCDDIQRNIFIVADMIVCGEKEGPVAPSPKNVGVIAMGKDQVLFDEAIVSLMGYDKAKIPFLVNARNVHGKYKLCSNGDNYEIVSNVPAGVKAFYIEPTSGWKEHIESNHQSDAS